MSKQTKPNTTSHTREEEEQEEQEEQEDRDDQALLDKQSAETRQIVETGSVTPTKGKYVIHCLTIVGQVEGHYILPPQNKTTKYEHVIPQLVAIQENPEIEGLIMILNTVGGDVEAGLAIAELISGMRKPTVSLVLGGGHSIGVPLAVSAKQSFIVPSATMTIHPVRMNGVVLGVPQTLSYFDKMQERIVRFVEENSNISSKQFRHLMMNTGELVMDVGTVLDGQQAVEKGLIDHLGGLSDAIQCLYDLIEKGKEEAHRKRRQEKDLTPVSRQRKRAAGGQSGREVQPKRAPAAVRARQIRYDSYPHSLSVDQSMPARGEPAGISRRNRANSARDTSHTIYQSGSRRAGDTAAARIAIAEGGEHSDVNPFGIPAPHAD